MATYKKNDWLNNDFIDKVNASNAEKLPGQTDELYERAHETFKQSDESLDNYETVKESKSNYKEIASKKDIISKDVKDDLNLNFDKPTSVKQADRYLASQLKKIQSGRTSYSDQVRDMMDKIMNREKFSYDVDNDPLFQQALASSMNSGKQAMQDTIGQASALTGGYGSTYATSAGNQVYNSFIEDAYDNLPQYYQMALDAYQMEGEEMYRQFGVVSEMDDKEFNRNVAAYDATYQHRNQMYNEAYGEFRDTKNDAFNMANLQLNEHGQRVSDAYNLYNAEINYADSMYEKEYTQWADKVNLAWKETELLYDNAWKNKEFDEDVRQFDTNFAEQQRQYNESLAEQKRQHNEQMSYNWAALNQRGSGSGGGSDLTTTEMKKLEEIYIKAGGGQAGIEKVDSYLSSIGKNNLSKEASAGLKSTLNDVVVPDYYQNWTISNDTKNWNNWFVPGNDDNNDVYSNGTTTMTFKELKKVIENSDLDESTKKSKIENLRKQSKK